MHEFHCFKFFYKQCPHYLNEVFVKAPKSSWSSRNDYNKLQQPFHKTSTSQNALSFIGSALLNKIPGKIKITSPISIFKHNLKRHYQMKIGNSSFLR